MKRVLTAIVLIPLVLLLIFKAPSWAVAVVVGLVGILSVVEYLKIVEGFGFGSLRKTTLTVAALWAALIVWQTAIFRGRLELPIFVCLFVLLLLPIYLALALRAKNLKHALPSAAMSFFALPYILLTLTCVLAIHARGGAYGWFLLTYLFLVVWSGDIFALYVGRSIGKTPFAPRISPKKTWEGAIGSFLGSILVGTLWFRAGHYISVHLLAWGFIQDSQAMHLSDFLPPALSDSPVLVPIVLSALLNIAAQLGDLVESMMKRGADI